MRAAIARVGQKPPDRFPPVPAVHAPIERSQERTDRKRPLADMGCPRQLDDHETQLHRSEPPYLRW